MASITAVELGADTCVLARTSMRRGEVGLSAVEILNPSAFPIDALAVALRQTRRSLRLPRRCRVVLWGLPDGAKEKDAAVKPLLAPLTAAGFSVERVVTPCNALGALARLRSPRGDGSTCWLAINRGGVAVIVVRPGKLLYSHSFGWDSSVGAIGSQARLLQRYSLVAHLSPEVKRAMAVARKAGTPVQAVVTCGNLPDLRGLTMPLIEELDVEVETLDSLEGLVVDPKVAEKLAATAPALRLACAAVTARSTRPWDPTKKQLHAGAWRMFVRAAALVALVGGLGYLSYLRTRPIAPAAIPAAVKPPVMVPQAPHQALPLEPPRPAPASVPPAPVHPVITLPRPDTPAPGPSPLPPKPPALNTPGISADKPDVAPAAGVRPTRTAGTGPETPALLTDAIPKVTAILVSKDRRLVTVEGGQIVGIGALLGRRTVVAVDEHSVVLREPSGLKIRVGIGGRLLGIERDAR
jgi:hypothetical protein